MCDAKAYLQQVKLYDTQINNKIEELDRLRTLATKVTTVLKGDVVSNSGNLDKLGDTVAKIADLQTEINQAVDEYVDKRKEISSVIERVNNADQCRVLHKRYFDYLTWEQIACDMGFTYRNVCYIHGRALQAVTAILEGDKR